MYSSEIEKLDRIATNLYASGNRKECTSIQILAGRLQQELLSHSPYKGRRFLNAQWCWALGHIGLLNQLTRWFRKYEPETKLILETKGSIANEYFLASLTHVEILERFPSEYEPELMHNAVYFACPDGVHSIHNFYKMVEAQCKDIPLLTLSYKQIGEAEKLLQKMNVNRPFVALQARHMNHDSKRNVSLEQIQIALGPYLARGFDVVCVGLDNHPADQKFPSVRNLPNPWLASFLLSASCDQYIGSNSGAWTIAHAFGRPVELMNDYQRLAWLYPEEVIE